MVGVTKNAAERLASGPSFEGAFIFLVVVACTAPRSVRPVSAVAGGLRGNTAPSSATSESEFTTSNTPPKITDQARSEIDNYDVRQTMLRVCFVDVVPPCRHLGERCSEDLRHSCQRECELGFACHEAGATKVAKCATGDRGCSCACVEPPSPGPPFDRAAAVASLGRIANDLASCKNASPTLPAGPTGSGHVKVTFNASGSVDTVELDSGPFPGTAAGGCVAAKFRRAIVPPFSRSGWESPHVVVGKSFVIE